MNERNDDYEEKEEEDDDDDSLVKMLTMTRILTSAINVSISLSCCRFLGALRRHVGGLVLRVDAGHMVRRNGAECPDLQYRPTTARREKEL